jgi:NAD(P)-dependent dehydrogenase (short-subunit alcohol dehydrogenase family)
MIVQDGLGALRNTHVVVIGGSAGIGRAISKGAVDAGARVTIASRNAERVREAAAALGSSVAGGVVDQTDARSLNAFFAKAGQIDHLVLAGSEVKPGPFRSQSIADAQTSMVSKFWGQYAAIKAAKVAPTGSIVLFSGAASRKVNAGVPALSAINAAIEALGKALAVELAPIRVNVVSPGIIDTDLWAGIPKEARAATLARFTEKNPVARPGTAEEVAAMVLAMLANTFMTGAVIDVDGGALLA